MKKLNKLAMALAIGGASLSVMAADVTITYDGDAKDLEYESIEISSNGAITVNLASAWPPDMNYACGDGTIPNNSSECVAVPVEPTPGSTYCGADTNWVDGLCIGIGGGSGGDLSCGSGTEEDPDENECVPAEKPTLAISSNTPTLGTGVTSTTVTFTFTRPVSEFGANAVTIVPSAHTLTGFSSNNNDTVWTATLNRSGNTAGTIELIVAAGAYESANGAQGQSSSHTINLEGESNGGNIPNVDLSACGGSWPSGVEFEQVLDLGNPGSQETIALRQQVKSLPFKAANSSSLFGSFTFGSTVFTSGIGREVWVSTCPTKSSAGSICQATGTETSTIKWANSNKRGYSCQLTPGQQYFLQVRNTNCPTGMACNVYNIIYRN